VSEFRRALTEGQFFVLDGATGTMLQAAGMPAGIAPERFGLERPEVL
jgi:5-methyltetrahydrofolate--homocysteine methyltransferase